MGALRKRIGAAFLFMLSGAIGATDIYDERFSVVGEWLADGRISGLAIDAQGGVNYSMSSFKTDDYGIYTFRGRSGKSRKWSLADGFDLQMTDTDVGYLAGRAITNNLIQVQPDGTFAEIPGTAGRQWLYVYPSPDNTELYASDPSRLYRVDPWGGGVTYIDTGTVYFFLGGAFGVDGRLHVLAQDLSTPARTQYLYRVDDAGLVPVAELPDSCFGLAADPFGNFYAVQPGADGSGLYLIEPGGSVRLVAKGFGAGDSVVAYDPKTARLYTGGQLANGPITIFQTANPKRNPKSNR